MKKLDYTNEIAVKQKKTSFWSAFRRELPAWLLFLPSLILLYLIIWRPVARGLALSFFELKGYTPVKFVGFDNFKYIFTDTLFLKTLANTLQYVLWSIVIGYFLPVVVAIMLNEVVHAKGLFKFSIYLPVMIPAVASAMIWYFLYQPGTGGLLNTILGKLGLPASQWLQNPKLTIPLIVITMTWKGFGQTAILYLASLQGVNQELYEASKIDGAGTFRQVWHVTLPQIRGIMMLMLIQQIMNVFQVMVEPLAMTGGGPDNGSLSLALQGYYYAFMYFKVDKSIALSVVTFLILIVFSIFYFKLQKKFEDE